jgi:hypothetical protein
MARKSSAQGSNLLYNLITVILLVLTVLVIFGVIAAVVTNPPASPGIAGEPTLFVPPTVTATLRGPTPNATWTASPTLTMTASATSSRTPIPSKTATPTNTSTATSTMTASPSPTITPTFTATFTPTRTPFDFSYSVTFTANSSSLTNNNAGCSWSAIAGTVLNKSGAHLTGMVVRVTGGNANINMSQTSGSHTTNYGASGWEVYLNNNPQSLNGETFNIWLEYSDGKAATATSQITTQKNCTGNLALVTFKQLQDRQ